MGRANNPPLYNAIYIFRCGEVRCGGLRCGEVWCGEVCGEVLTSTSRMFTNYTETA